MGNALDRFAWFAGVVVAGTLDENAVREGFTPGFLTSVPVARLVDIATTLKSTFASEPVQREEDGDAFTVRFTDWVITGAVESDAPHRFAGIMIRPVPLPLADARLAHAPFVAEGDAPLPALKDAFRDYGLIGVVAGGFTNDGADQTWRAAGGYADLEGTVECTPSTRMLAGSIVKLLTATAALTLVADGRVDLDAPANTYLRSLRVESDAVTVRHLLTHTSGVSSDFNHFVAVVPPVTEILGESVAVDFEPGSQFVYSNGGYTVLGEVIAGVTGAPVIDALTEIVVAPLGMTDSTFALAWPDDVGPGYTAEDGLPVELPRTVPSVPAAGGLVTTTRDLARFVAGWRSLLPGELALAAVTPQFTRPDGGAIGFGWIVSDDFFGHAGGTLTYTSSLAWRRRDGAVNVLLTNRSVQADDVNLRLLSEPSEA